MLNLFQKTYKGKNKVSEWWNQSILNPFAPSRCVQTWVISLYEFALNPELIANVMLGQCDCWYEKIYSYLLKMAMVLSWNIIFALRKGSLEESSVSSPKSVCLPLVALLPCVCIWDHSDILIWCERWHCEFHWKTSHSLWESIKCSAWTALHWFSDLFKNKRYFIFSALSGIILCVTHSNSRTKKSLIY